MTLAVTVTVTVTVTAKSEDAIDRQRTTGDRRQSLSGRG
ncbi:hypothetical protein P3T22_003519 [Paraburkholderia sp. GAS348]